MAGSSVPSIGGTSPLVGPIPWPLKRSGTERRAVRGLARRGFRKGQAVFGLVVSAIWFPIAVALGRRYEHVRSGDQLGTREIEDPHRVGGSPAP